MNAYEKLQEEACKDGIDVIDYPFESENIKGLYCDGTVATRKKYRNYYRKSLCPGRRARTPLYSCR